MKKTIPVLLLTFLFSAICHPQTKPDIYDVRNVYDEKGDQYLNKKDFKKAIVYYNMAFKKDTSNYYSVLKKAEAYTSLGLWDQAAECYRIVFDSNLDIPNDNRLRFALLLLKNKDIKGFEKWMSIYNELVRSEIHDYQTGTDIRAKMYYDSSIVIVENENVLNTTGSEICPFVYKDRIIFASTMKNVAGSPGTDYNLFSAEYLNSGQLGRLNIFNQGFNTTLNERSVFCSDKLNKIFITRGSSPVSGLKTIKADMPDHINSVMKESEFFPEGFTGIGHVSFNNEGTRMYFVSDAPGGFGGSDIYSSDFSGGRWSKPKNLGSSVNTAKDEMYPFVLNDTVIYFASAGHPGMGGLDLFSFNLNGNNRSPENLGKEVNSAGDDYGLSFSSDGLTGYFCSNRPGGFGKEDIYRLHLLHIKVRYPAYRPRNSSVETNLVLSVSNGSEFSLSSGTKGFGFSFQPGEDYKMIIQHENPLVSNIIYNTKISGDQRRNAFLFPLPLEKTEIKLQEGVKYQFTLGKDPISNEYKGTLSEMSEEYENSSGYTDLILLAKELPLKEGEIYTIQFIQEDQNSAPGEKSNLFINEKIVDVSGESFFMIVPQKDETTFTVQTDLAFFKKNYSPKKAGTVKVDSGPVFKEEKVELTEGFPILVNTPTFDPGKKISATELSIIPGTMYVLTFGDKEAGPDQTGVTIPLTKGVKYNLGTGKEPDKDYYKALTQIKGQTAGTDPGEELIDISVLSKELDIFSERNIVFSLMPARQITSQNQDERNVLTTLAVDGRKYFITGVQKMQVNLKLDENEKINIQTDLHYVKENFDPSTIVLNVDTSSVNRNLAEKRKTVITDPVYDVVVVNFNLNDYSVRPGAKTILVNKVIDVLGKDNRLYVTVKGYTDPLGDAAHNEILSKNRAQAVKDFLMSNGVGEERIRTFSYGATQALKEGVNWKDLSESELEKYRKVEIVIYLPK